MRALVEPAYMFVVITEPEGRGLLAPDGGSLVSRLRRSSLGRGQRSRPLVSGASVLALGVVARLASETLPTPIRRSGPPRMVCVGVGTRPGR